MSADDHGSASTYTNHACRCPQCTEAHTLQQARMRASRIEALARGEVIVPHGRYSTYRNYACRCPDCRAAHAKQARKFRRKQRDRVGS